MMPSLAKPTEPDDPAPFHEVEWSANINEVKLCRKQMAELPQQKDLRLHVAQLR